MYSDNNSYFVLV